MVDIQDFRLDCKTYCKHDKILRVYITRKKELPKLVLCQAWLADGWYYSKYQTLRISNFNTSLINGTYIHINLINTCNEPTNSCLSGIGNY